MLEGLEIKEIKLSDVRSFTNYFRIDDGYYLKEYLKLDTSIIKFGFEKLNDLTTQITDFGAFSQTNFVSFQSTGYLFLRNQDIKDNYFDSTNCVYISKEIYDRLTLHLKENDVVIPRVGTLGSAAVIKKQYLPCSANQNLAVLRLKDNISPYYISTLLTSNIGKNQINRTSTGNVQQWLNLEAISSIKIPNISFQYDIEKLVLTAHSKIELSKQTYTKAEEILLEEIGLQNFEPSKEPVNIKSFKESFGVTGRLDAEYYQIKYEQIIKKIVSQKHDSLINIVDISKSIEPGSNHYSNEEGLPFYRVSDYNKFGLSKPDKELTKSFVDDNKDLIAKLKPKKDTILFSKDGSVGTAYLLRNDLEGITSSAILHLKVKNTKEILPEYLTLALNSKLVQMQAERDAGGSIILHWRKEEIEQVVVPIIDFKKQEQIAELVEESFKLKVESERLLEVAKKAVEIAIEESEDVALKYLSNYI